MADLFSAHDADWCRFTRSIEASAALRRWTSRHPTFAAFDSLDALLAAVANRRCPDTQDDLLLALLTEARDDLAARRTVLRAITPGLVRIVRSYRGVWSDDDSAAMVAVAALERIASYPLHRKTAVAANLVRDVRNRLYRQRLRDHPHLVAVALPEDGISCQPQRTAREEVLDLVGHALDDGTLTRRAAQLIVLHRVFDIHGPALASIDGGSYEAVRKYRLRAEATLARVTAPEVA